MRAFLFAIVVPMVLLAEAGNLAEGSAPPEPEDFSVPALICVDGRACRCLGKEDVAMLMDGDAHVGCEERYGR